MFSFSKKIEGYISYYGLEEWWLNKLSKIERKIILKSLTTDGTGIGLINSKNLTSGKISFVSAGLIQFMSSFVGCFDFENEEKYRENLIRKIETVPIDSSNVLDFHFLYSSLVGLYYRLRENEVALEKTIVSCKRQIDLSDKSKKAFLKEYPRSALPSHVGYKQLSIIYEKQKEFQKAIDICQIAKSQGWAGDWENRIERYTKKLTSKGGKK